MGSRIQSILDPAGVQAARIEDLWWLMFWVTTAVFVLVLVALTLAVVRGRSAPPEARPTERRLLIGVTTATALTIAALVGLLYASVATGRAMGEGVSPEALVVQITGQQWWWAIEYQHDQPSMRVTTANELHIPVGRQVVVNLRSNDVIHSFWVPPLHGKMDLIPGRLNTTWIRADAPGTFRGQCAEYCGLQHAHMGMLVIAQPQDEFDRWLDAQRQPAAQPSTPEQTAGREIVEKGPCAMCHTVRGTQAGARMGPDLTHVASRRSLAAATVPHDREWLTRWIAAPQDVKPGNRMPSTGLSPDELRAVVAYLEALR